MQLKRKTSYYLGRFRNGTSLYPNLVWGGTVRIGKGSEIGERCRISIANSLDIGEQVLLSPNVYITDCDHEYRNIDVSVINQGIVQYYKKYGTYTLYFFIDAAFMTCKINGVDDDVLMKSQKCDGDMFLLSKVGNYPYNEACICYLDINFLFDVFIGN